MADFLFEIGLEEMPARMIAGAQAELLRRTVAMLRLGNLLSSQDERLAVSFSTPRRLALLVRDIFDKQLDTTAKVQGPSVKIAYKDGLPTPAAEAFARKNGLSVAELKVESMEKGDYVVADTQHKGRAAADVIAAEMPKILGEIYWAKNMYWRAGRPERFVRPVRWMVALLGDEVVPVEFGGYTAGRETFGHRVLNGGGAVRVESPETYVETMKAAFVMAEVEARRHTIRKALDRVCRTAGDGTLRWREDHALVDKMTHLTEWPSVIAGGFDAEYLALPEEVLVTVMRDHQSYFAIEDGTGKLAPYFLAVLNTVARAEGEAVIRHGNERVLRARFNDARFFWEFDQRVLLEERVALLEKVTFQKDLGSYAAKSERVTELCRRLVGQLGKDELAVDFNAIVDAARLAKTDLTTELVKEFTELQGVVGGLYARAQGISETVAAAMSDQYKPMSMEDMIPATGEGQLLAIADKADTIAGMFGLGLEPTGSKDPFALRRAGNGIVKILAEGSIGLGLGVIVRASVGGDEGLTRKLEVFLAERLDFYLREAKGQAYDVVKAVLAVGSDDVRDAVARAEAVTAVRGSEDFAAVSAAFKRMKNILAQAAEKGEQIGNFTGLRGSAVDRVEMDLLEAAQDVRVSVAQHQRVGEYVAALKKIASLRPLVDQYFEEVMILAPEPGVRRNRLEMLSFIFASMQSIANLSEIVVVG